MINSLARLEQPLIARKSHQHHTKINNQSRRVLYFTPISATVRIRTSAPLDRMFETHGSPPVTRPRNNSSTRRGGELRARTPNATGTPRHTQKSGAPGCQPKRVSNNPGPRHQPTSSPERANGDTNTTGTDVASPYPYARRNPIRASATTPTRGAVVYMITRKSFRPNRATPTVTQKISVVAGKRHLVWRSLTRAARATRNPFYQRKPRSHHRIAATCPVLGVRHRRKPGTRCPRDTTPLRRVVSPNSPLVYPPTYPSRTNQESSNP